MSDATHPTADSQKDPATLEREIDQTRTEMNQTLNALERKFSPGEFLDQGLSYVQQHGGQLVSGLGDAIRENPMPALLTAAGVVWMVLASNRPKTALKARTVDYEYDPPAQDYNQTDWTENKPGVAAQAGERIRSGAEATRQKLTSSKEAVASRLGRTAEAAQAQAMRAREGFNSALEEQPLILGALGIALGAAIGAALPRTEQEDRLLGQASDATISRVKETGSESFNRVKENV
ncbi:MAG TPA: DUF3618 domain-containing protein, partial [Candidatus Binatia bacterium]|nr:DUF3618 domain-containing protein [Candidatus Binatia bacterium]